MINSKDTPNLIKNSISVKNKATSNALVDSKSQVAKDGNSVQNIQRFDVKTTTNIRYLNTCQGADLTKNELR